MGKVPSLPYYQIVAALQREGWVVIRHRGGSHIQMQRRSGVGVMRLTVPAHRPVKRTTLAKILKHAQIDIDRFLELL